MTDEVSALIAAWRRVRPDLDVEPLAVWSRIARLAALLDAARRHAYAAHSLQGWEFDVLAALRRAGEPYQLSPGQLIKQTHVTSGTMTTRVDRLSSRGLVTREAHPEDGRGVIVSLTEPGLEAVEAAFADLLDVERELERSLTPAEHEQLAGLLSALLRAQTGPHPRSTSPGPCSTSRGPGRRPVSPPAGQSAAPGRSQDCPSRSRPG